MIAYLNRGNGRVFVTAVGGGGDQPRAFMSQEIGPGWRFLGRTYEEWIALPDGPHPVPDDYDPDNDHPPPGVGVPVAADAPAADVPEQPEDQPVRALLLKIDGRFRVWGNGSKPGHPLVTLLEDVEPGSRIRWTHIRRVGLCRRAGTRSPRTGIRILTIHRLARAYPSEPLAGNREDA